MTITLHGFEPVHELHMVANLCAERGLDIPSGHFTDTTFETDGDVSPDVAQAIGGFFAPTPAQWIEARERAKREELFAEYDKKVLQSQREVRLGIVGAEARLAAWDAYAEALRAVNDIEGWFRDPQWPQKPEI